MAGNELPGLTDIYKLMREHCDILAGALQALIDCEQYRGEETAGQMRATWRQDDALRERLLDMLERSSAMAADFIDIFRAVIALDIPIDCARTRAGRILDIGLRTDRVMLEMIAENKNCVQALQRGFYKLKTNRLGAEQDARAARISKRNSEKLYLKALSESRFGEEPLTMWKVDRENSKAIPKICGILERGEIYHDLARSAEQLVWAANRLQEIAFQAAT